MRTRRVRDWLGLKLLGKTAEQVASLEDIQRRMMAIELAWAETLDFIQHWASRQSKRDQRAIKVKLDEPPAGEAPHHESLGPSSTSHDAKAELRRRAAALRPGGIHLRTGSDS